MEEILLLCVLAFFAGLVDAVAGGGGLIQVPALFAVFPSVSPAILLGTNKVSSIAGTSAATLRYARTVPIPWRAMFRAALFVAGTAALGAWSVTQLPPSLLRPVVLMLLIAVLAYSVLHPREGVRESRAGAPSLAEALYSGAIGFYDGFFGPGAGAFLMFGLVKWFRCAFLEAAARARIVNLASNAGALSVFLAAGSVDLSVGVPMAGANVAGAYLGASAAVKKGASFIRRIFLLVVAALIVKLALDLWR